MDFEEIGKRIAEATEELGKLEYGDSKREKLVEEIETLSKIYLEAEKSDTTRINSNIQNDLAQDRLALDIEKVKTEKGNSRRELLGTIIKTIASLGGTIGLGIISFKGEWLMNILKDRTLWDLAKTLKPRN